MGRCSYGGSGSALIGKMRDFFCGFLGVFGFDFGVF